MGPTDLRATQWALALLGLAAGVTSAAAQALPTHTPSVTVAHHQPQPPPTERRDVESAGPLVGAVVGGLLGATVTCTSDQWSSLYLGVAVGIGLGAHFGNGGRGNVLGAVGASLLVLGVTALLVDLSHPPAEVGLFLPFSQMAAALWAEMATTPPRAADSSQPLPDPSAGR